MDVLWGFLLGVLASSLFWGLGWRSWLKWRSGIRSRVDRLAVETLRVGGASYEEDSWLEDSVRELQAWVRGL